MKEIDNRQNKMLQTKAWGRSSRRASFLSKDFSQPQEGLRKGGAVFGLVSNLLMASKIAQSAAHCHLAVHNFDEAEPILTHVQQKHPILIILDWDDREAEAFKLLSKMRQDEAFKKIPAVGYVSQPKAALKSEAERAGCDRVYTKTEFLKSLNEILMRYAQ